MSKGLIKSCVNANCGWKCCDFGSKGHIVMLPGEYEKAKENTSHLSIVDNDYNGGKKAKCIAIDKANCDGGYKPIQCRTYPLFVDPASQKILRSTRCPLIDRELKGHVEYSVELVQSFVEARKMDAFFNKVQLNSYIELGMAIVVLGQEHTEKIRRYENTLTEPELCLKTSDAELEKCIKSECSVGIIKDKELVAYSLLYYNEYGIAIVEKCFVSKSHRGSGYQKIMLNQNIELSRQKGVFVLYAMTSPKNTKSIASFTASGFEIYKKTICEGHERLILKHEISNR